MGAPKSYGGGTVGGGMLLTVNHIEPQYLQTYEKCECGYNNQFNDTDTCTYCGEKLKVSPPPEQLGYSYRYNGTTEPLHTMGSTTPIYVYTGSSSTYGTPYEMTQTISPADNGWIPTRVEMDNFGRETREFTTKSGKIKRETWQNGSLLNSEEVF